MNWKFYVEEESDFPDFRLQQDTFLVAIFADVFILIGYSRFARSLSEISVKLLLYEVQSGQIKFICIFHKITA